MNKKSLIFLTYIIIAISFLLVGILLGRNYDNKLEKYKETTLITQKIAIATFLINENDTKHFISQNDLNISNNMINTYKKLINSQVVKDKVKEKYPNVRDIELQQVEGTSILKAIYICDNYTDDECIEITDKYVTAFAESIVDIYNIRSVSIVNSASISTRLIEK